VGSQPPDCLRQEAGMSDRRRHRGDILHFRQLELVRLFRRRLGPEPNKLQLEEAIRNAVGDPMNLTARELGQMVNLTLVERSELYIRTFQACDPTPEESRAHYRAKRRERDRAGARRRRGRRKKRMIKPKFHRQTGRVQTALRERSETNPLHWSTVEEITDAVAEARAFQGLKPDSMRKIIHRTLDALVEDGRIESDTGIGKCSLSLRLVRWKGR
jgi:hypothetical protein